MLFKCCLLHRDIVLPRNATFSMFLYVLFLLCVLFMWSICHYRFHFHYLCDLFAIIVFIFITINRVISMTQANLFFGHVCQKLASGFCLAFVKKKNVQVRKNMDGVTRSFSHDFLLQVGLHQSSMLTPLF